MLYCHILILTSQALTASIETNCRIFMCSIVTFYISTTYLSCSHHKHKNYLLRFSHDMLEDLSLYIYSYWMNIKYCASGWLSVRVILGGWCSIHQFFVLCVTLLPMLHLWCFWHILEYFHTIYSMRRISVSGYVQCLNNFHTFFNNDWGGAVTSRDRN